MPTLEDALRSTWLEVLSSTTQGTLFRKMLSLRSNRGDRNKYSDVRVVACIICATTGSSMLRRYQSLLDEMMTVCPQDLVNDMRPACRTFHLDTSLLHLLCSACTLSNTASERFRHKLKWINNVQSFDFNGGINAMIRHIKTRDVYSKANAMPEEEPAEELATSINLSHRTASIAVEPVTRTASLPLEDDTEQRSSHINPTDNNNNNDDDDGHSLYELAAAEGLIRTTFPVADVPTSTSSSSTTTASIHIVERSPSAHTYQILYVSFPNMLRYLSETAPSAPADSSISSDAKHFVLYDVTLTRHMTCSVDSLVSFVQGDSAVKCWAAGDCSSATRTEFLMHGLHVLSTHNSEHTSAYLAGQALGAIISRPNAALMHTLVIVSDNGADVGAVQGNVTLIGVTCLAIQLGWCVTILGRKNALHSNLLQLRERFPDIVTVHFIEEFE